MSNNIQLFKNENYNGIQMDFYELNGEKVVTRKQITAAVGLDSYRSISHMHKRYPDEFILGEHYYTIPETLVTNCNQGGKRTKDMFLYNMKGLQSICNHLQNKTVARQFNSWCQNVVSTVINTGKYSIVEQNINKLVTDPKEKELLLQIDAIENLAKIKPDDPYVTFLLKQTGQELINYRTNKQLSEINEKLNRLDDKMNNRGKLIPRNGEYTAKQVAKYLDIYSKHNNPHESFINAIAVDCGLKIKDPMIDDNMIRTNLDSVVDYTQNVLYKNDGIDKIKTWLDNNAHIDSYDSRTKELKSRHYEIKSNNKPNDKPRKYYVKI